MKNKLRAEMFVQGDFTHTTSMDASSLSLIYIYLCALFPLHKVKLDVEDPPKFQDAINFQRNAHDSKNSKFNAAVSFCFYYFLLPPQLKCQ